MPAAKAMASLSGMVDSDDARSDVDMMSPPDSNQENQPETRTRKPGKAAVKTKKAGKPASKRLSGGKTRTTKAKTAAAKREALKEQTNTQHHSDTEEVDEFEEPEPATKKEIVESANSEEEQEAPAKKPARKGRPPGKAKQTAAAKKAIEKAAAAEKVKATERDGEFEYTPTLPRQGKRMAKVKQDAEPDMLAEQAAPKTQNDDQFPDEPTVMSIEGDDIVPQSVHRQPSRARSNSKQPQPQAPSIRRRAGSASDNERSGNNAALHRKLGELTLKYESLEVKYHNLRDVGIKEAEANFDRLRKQSDERTKAANDLIESLRTELSTQRTLAKNARSELSSLKATRADLSSAEARIAKLTSSLSESQNENRVLQAKLAAARTASEAAAAAASTQRKTPGRGGGAAAGASGSGNNNKSTLNGVDAAQVAQLKEDLYSDLTGLILRGVERKEEGEVYDCIQTGRNGTLHFKLIIAADAAGANTTSYEDTEFQYMPCLDANRDRDLIEILPDYLSEDITFSRVNAAKFYSRVVDTLTRRVVD